MWGFTVPLIFLIATWLTICYHHPQNSPDSPASLAHFERILSSPKLTCHPLPAGEFQLRMSEFPLFLLVGIYYILSLKDCMFWARCLAIYPVSSRVGTGFFPTRWQDYQTSNSRENICLIHIPLGCQVEGSWGVATKEALIIRITSTADNVTPWPWKMAAETRQLCCWWWVFFHQNPFETICDTSKWVIFFLPRKGKGVKIEKIYLSCHHLQKMGLHSLKLTTNGPENRPVRKRKWSSSKHQFPGANS